MSSNKVRLLVNAKPVIIAKLDAIVPLLASGKSKLEISAKGTQRVQNLYAYFTSPEEVSLAFAEKVCKEVLRKKYGVQDIQRKWGDKGLSAIWRYPILKENDRKDKALKEAVRLRRKGEPYERISAAVGLSFGAIYNYCARIGLDKEVRNVVQLSLVDRNAKILRDYKAGETVSSIAEKLNIPYRRVYAVIRKAGIYVRKPAPQLTLDDVHKIYMLRSKVTHPLSWVDLGILYGLPPETLKKQYYILAGGLVNAKN